MKLLDFILDLLFPRKCMICRKVLDKSNPHTVCFKCESELPYAGENGRIRKLEFVEAVCFPFFYRGKFADAIKRYKFSNCKGYSAFFAAAMAKCIKKHFDGKFDIITWVPISSKRFKARGYNQSQILAEQIAAELGIETVPLLIKHKDTPAQSSIGQDERRRANVLGTYRLKADVKGKRILIIDDIVTSGATFTECALTLLIGGAEIIYGAAIASARK